MHRNTVRIRYRIRSTWLLATVGLAMAVAACGPPTVTLERLVVEHDHLAGRRVTVAGRVVPFEEPDGTEYFVLEDDRQNRVLLLPADRVQGHAGEEVVVTGEFDFDPEMGRMLRIEELRPLEADPIPQVQGRRTVVLRGPAVGSSRPCSGGRPWCRSSPSTLLR